MKLHSQVEVTLSICDVLCMYVCMYVHDMYVRMYDIYIYMMYTCTLFIVRVELVRRRGISGRGDVINSVSSYNLSETIKVSLLTSLFHPSHPFHVDMRRGDRANDQFDFLLFITRCISTNLLIRGDVLVLDNASIHKADNILLPLHMLLNTAGITMWFLPTYSPELNPCEFVFAQCKKYLRYHRRMHLPFWYEITMGLAQTTHMHMYNCYIKSIWNP